MPMPKRRRASRDPHAPARLRVGAAAATGLLVAAVVAAVVRWDLATLLGWDGAALVYLAWTWSSVWGMTATATAEWASREDPSRAAADLLLLIASVASLLAVGLVLLRAGARQWPEVALGVGSVVLSWAIVHTVFALRYARLYYTGAEGGVDFNQEARPCYADFAYLAFTIGMTFQVSDTALRATEIRRAALRHALLSYLFGTVIVALTINLLAGLSR